MTEGDLARFLSTWFSKSLQLSTLVFICMFLLDFVWAKYTYAITAKRPMVAGVYASILIVFSGGAAIGYVNDPWMLIPAALGAFLGTAVAVVWEPRE